MALLSLFTTYNKPPLLSLLITVASTYLVMEGVLYPLLQAIIFVSEWYFSFLGG